MLLSAGTTGHADFGLDSPRGIRRQVEKLDANPHPHQAVADFAARGYFDAAASQPVSK